MKKLNIFYMGEKLCEVYPHATRFQVFKFKVRKAIKHAFRLSMAGGLLYGAFMAGAYLNPLITYATIEKIVPTELPSLVMERIAKCESNNSHYDKSGQVLTRGNTNKSVDTGKYQINSVWHAKATELGLDITKEKDNEAFAMYLYRTYGTEPWYSSKHCWTK